MSDSKSEITFDDFLKLDLRCGQIIEVKDFERARNPSWRLRIDFGEGVGIKQCSAQIKAYSQEELLGIYVICVVNFAPRNIAGFLSEVLLLGVSDSDGAVRVLSPLASSGLVKGSAVH